MTPTTSSPDDASPGRGGGIMPPLVTGLPVIRSQDASRSAGLMPPLFLGDGEPSGSRDPEGPSAALGNLPDPTEAFEISPRPEEAIETREPESDERLPWLDETPRAASAGIRGWEYDDGVPSNDLEIGTSAAELGADTQTDSFVAAPAEGDPDSGETIGLDPWGAHRALREEARAPGSAGESESLDYLAEVERPHTPSADSWEYLEPDYFEPEPLPAAQESKPDVSAPLRLAPVGGTGEIADRLERIARALREKGPEGPLADNAGDPLSALITGYLFGLKQKDSDR